MRFFVGGRQLGHPLARSFSTQLMHPSPALLAGDRDRILRGDAVHPRAVGGLAVPGIAHDPALRVQTVELAYRAS
jgi:hypothetical protein